MKGKLFKDSAYIIFSQLTAKIIAFIYAVFLAKSIGVENFGLYAAAISYFGIISSLTDFGISRYLTREISKDNQNIRDLFFNVALTRFILMTIVIMLVSLLIFTFDPEPVRSYLSIIVILSILPFSLGVTFDNLVIALQKPILAAISALVLNVSLVTLGIFLIYSGYGVFGAVIAFVLGHIIYLCVSYLLVRGLKLNIQLKFDWKVVKKILAGSWVYGVLGVIGLISFRMDTLILSYFRGNFETGLYSMSYRFLDAAIIIPSSFALILFPVLSTLSFNNSHQKLGALYFKSLKVMLLLGTSIALLYFFLLPFLINLFLPAYRESILSLRILSLSLPFIFLHIPTVQIIMSSEKYLFQALKLFLLLFMINLSLALMLIPSFGIVAASWLTVFSEVMTFVTFFIFVYIINFKKQT